MDGCRDDDIGQRRGGGNRFACCILVYFEKKGLIVYTIIKNEKESVMRRYLATVFLLLQILAVVNLASEAMPSPSFSGECARDEDCGEHAALHPTLAEHLARVKSGRARVEDRLHLYEEGLELRTALDESLEALLPSKGPLPFDASSNNIVMGLVWGLPAETARFVRSWARHAPGVRMLLLVPTKEDVRQKAHLERQFGAEIIHVHLSHYKSAGGELERFELYKRLLSGDLGNLWPERRPPRDAWVTITDVRDVVVQDDPFARARALWPSKVVFGAEDARLTVGTCPFNAAWISYLFGQAGLDRMRDAPVSCSGVTIGAIDPLLKYLAAMSELAAQVVAQTGGYGNVRRGSDQGIHNCLVHGHCGTAPPKTFDAETDGAFSPNSGHRCVVHTMAWVPWSEVRIDAFGRVRTAGGTFPAILHQFDRHIALKNMIDASYPIVVGKE